MTPRAFRRYLGIHYSGAETPDSGLKNLRVYSATPDTPPQEVLPPPGPRKYWSRRELAHWLAEQLAGNTPTLVGIDHALSFPLRYFEVHRLAPDWPFDGWGIPAGKSALVEVRPAVWRDLVPVAALDAGQKDAFVTASRLKGADGSGELSDLLQPSLSRPERVVCGVEGWILGAQAMRVERPGVARSDPG
jgi:hypothetical protein